MKLFYLAAALLILTSFNCMSHPKISFTFDDGDTSDVAGFRNNDWNQMILNHLKDNKITSAFFVKGKGLDNDKGKKIIQSWNDEGHIICNHTYTHRSYNSSSFVDYKTDFLKNDSLIKNFSNFTKFFRFPYLKEGETADKIQLFRELLKENSYRNGYVTIDASDWYINGRLQKN